MPATFNLEISPGRLIAIDTICESDELDMSRTEDGTLVAGMFMGKLDIVHDHDAKVHKMEFTGTRLKEDSYSSDFFFDSRTMGKLVLAAKPSIARCHISILSPDQQYCDIELKLSKFWKLGNTWPPVEMLGENSAKFFPVSTLVVRWSISSPRQSSLLCIMKPCKFPLLISSLRLIYTALSLLSSIPRT
jgi:hypothetical protein